MLQPGIDRDEGMEARQDLRRCSIRDEQVDTGQSSLQTKRGLGRRDVGDGQTPVEGRGRSS